MARAEPGARRFEAAELRRALGSFATGVTVVTTRAPDGRPVGMTASSFNAVSLEPPLVLWSIGRASANHAAFTTAKCWAVHVLALEQRQLAEHFARRGVDRFAGIETEPGLEGLPLLTGCAARFECRASAVHIAGDHSIMVGAVQRLLVGAEQPLVVHASRFAALGNRL